jgi:hypothetical protein
MIARVVAVVVVTLLPWKSTRTAYNFHVIYSFATEPLKLMHAGVKHLKSA